MKFTQPSKPVLEQEGVVVGQDKAHTQIWLVDRHNKQ